MCNVYLIIHIAIGCLILMAWSCRTLGCMPRCGIVFPKTVFWLSILYYHDEQLDTWKHITQYVSSYNTLPSYCVCTLTDDLLKVMRTMKCSFQPIRLQ